MGCRGGTPNVVKTHAFGAGVFLAPQSVAGGCNQGRKTAMTELPEMTTTQLKDLFGPVGFSPNGFDYSWSRKDGWKDGKGWSDDVVEQVRVCATWLSQCKRTKTLNRRTGSYQLKGECERWAGRYVSNGALLMAAHLLGFEIRQIAYGPNGWLNISRKGRPQREEVRVAGLPTPRRQ